MEKPNKEIYTDESQKLIDTDELKTQISALSLEEQNQILKQLLENSEKTYQTILENIKMQEILSKQRRVDNAKKRKVIAVKRVTPKQKEYFNNTIKEYREDIKSIINMSIEEFNTYIEYQNLESNINYYLLGLIKELITFNKMSDEAYLLKDAKLYEEIKNSIEILSAKINILKKRKATLEMKTSVIKKNKRRN